MPNAANHGPLTALAERVIHRVVQNSAFFYYARTHFYWGTMRRMRRALDLQPGERLLDVGCGSGMGAGLTKGTYIGVDTEMAYLRFAHGRLADAELACDLRFDQARTRFVVTFDDPFGQHVLDLAAKHVS